VNILFIEPRLNLVSTVILRAEVLVGLAERGAVERLSVLREEHGAGEGVAARQPFDVALELLDDVGVGEHGGGRVRTRSGADAQAADPRVGRFLEEEGEAEPFLGARGLHEGDELVGAAGVDALELERAEVVADGAEPADTHFGGRHARAGCHEVRVDELTERDGIAGVHRAEELERHALARGCGGLLGSGAARDSEHEHEHQHEVPGHAHGATPGFVSWRTGLLGGDAASAGRCRYAGGIAGWQR
jgi:hypothetical protein